MITIIAFYKTAYEDYNDWEAADKKIFRRIKDLIKDISRNPFAGIGKPEPLKHELSGYWSRRINDEHRLVYKVTDNTIYILSCKEHYKK